MGQHDEPRRDSRPQAVQPSAARGWARIREFLEIKKGNDIVDKIMPLARLVRWGLPMVTKGSSRNVR